MTVVDPRGKRTPASLRGREFSGPPKGERSPRGPSPVGPVGPGRPGASPGRPGASAGRPGASAGTRPGPTVSRRPGAFVNRMLAALGGGMGVAFGAANHDATGTAALCGYVLAAPLAAGLVHRGRALRLLVCCLPLAFVVDLTTASAVALHQGGTTITAKGTLEELGQILILHSPWLWLGTMLALAVGIRRGLVRPGNR